MNRIRLAVALFAFGCNAAAAQPVVTYYRTAAGFYVSRGGHVLTNHHVISDCRSYIVYHGAIASNATLVGEDKAHDLALLKTEATVGDVARFASLAERLQPGDDMTTAGYPGEAWKRQRPVLGQARLIAFTGPRGEPDFMQFNGKVELGNSGGPLLDRSANVVGVVSARSHMTRINTRTREVLEEKEVGVAIHPKTVRAFLARYHVPILSDDSSGLLSREQIARKAEDFSVNVRCPLPKKPIGN